jgi:hypothetical protein
MAQTSRKRRTKHRGNAAGVVEARGRTGRPPSPEERKKADRASARERRLSTPPTWTGAAKKGALAAVLVFAALLLTAHHSKGSSPIVPALIGALLALMIYIPAGFYFDAFIYRRRLAKQNSAVKR